ncbi:MAG TPA: alpha/beta fold hydrolase [Rhodospirillales bacterium]|nr:alpha/beta fold hydrolase [Rhodospirillales bacterium]
MGVCIMKIRKIQWAIALSVLINAGISLFPGLAKAEEVTMSLNGMTLNGNLELADGKSLEDGIILITHGTLSHNKTEIITTLQSLFLERSLSSLAINLSLGLDNRHGNFDCARPIDHRHTDAIDEIAGWVGWLEKKGTDSILVLGHSRGGNQTAWYLADNNNPIVRGGVLIAPATWDYAKVAKNYNKRYEKRLSVLLEQMKMLVSTGKGNEMIQNVDFLYCRNATVSARSFVSYYQDNPMKDTPRTLARVKKPVLVIAASEDQVVPDLVEKMAKSSLPGVRFQVIDGADHFFRDFYAEDIVDLTEDFMKSLP